MVGKGIVDVDQVSGNVQCGGDYFVMQNVLCLVVDYYWLIIKVKLGKCFFVVFQFEIEGVVKWYVIDENFFYQFQGCFGSKFRYNIGFIC